jgi:hypothetical protein
MAGKGKGVKKQLGRTWIEVNHEVLMFVVEDEDHPQIIGIQCRYCQGSCMIWVHALCEICSARCGRRR